MSEHNWTQSLETNLKLTALHTEQLDNNEQHAHEAGQVFCLKTGLAVLESIERRTIITSRQIGWIPPGVVHRAEEHGAVSGWAAYLSPPLAKALPPGPCLLRCSPFVSLIMERAVAWQNPPALTNRQANLLRVLLDELYAADPISQGLAFPQDNRLRALALLLAQQPAHEGKLAELAKSIGMSPRNCSRRFHEETGLTFSQWRQLARIYKSSELLAAGMPVRETAWNVGYESVSSFIAAFKNIFRITPSEVMPN